MNIIFMGPPGAGKGTQSDLIVKRWNIPHISTGEMFRDAVAHETTLGVKAQEYLDNGLLVPDDITIGIVKERLSADDCKCGYLLDGFPRTLEQANALTNITQGTDRQVELVLNLEIDRDILLERLIGRIVCPKCHATYHQTFNKPLQDGFCDVCNEKLVVRTDANSDEKIRTRLDIYYTQTEVLVDYYKKKHLLKSIDASRTIEAVYATIEEILVGYQR